MRLRSRRSLVASILGGVAVAACIPTSFGRPDSTNAGPSARPSAVVATALSGTAQPTSRPTSRPSFVRPTPTPQPTFLAYVVRGGDTLTSIARAYRTTARSIAFWNRSRYPSLDPDSPGYSPDRIKVGWILLLVPDLELDPEDLPPEPEPSPASAATPTGSDGL